VIHVLLGDSLWHFYETYWCWQVMKPEIPVRVLRLQTFSSLEYEIRLACTYYQNTLEKLIANCVRCRTSQELDEVLVELSTKCSRLRSLHIFCQLNQATVETILAQHPDMLRRNSYTLKYKETPHPWIAGFDSWYYVTRDSYLPWLLAW